MEYEALKIWIDIAQFGVTGGIGIWLWLVRKNDTTNVHLAQLERDVDQRLDNHAQRLAGLEADIKGLPTHKDLGDLYERVNQVAENLSQLTGEFRGVRDTLGLIHRQLLDNRK